MKDKLLRVDGFAQTGLDLEPGDNSLAHRLVEQFEARFTVGLGVIHGGIGIAQEVFGCAVRGPEGNSDASGGGYVPALQVKRLAEPFKDPRSDNRGGGLVPPMGEENRELVSAYPRHDGLSLSIRA